MPTSDHGIDLVTLFHRNKPDDAPIKIPVSELTPYMVQGYEQLRTGQSEVELPKVSGVASLSPVSNLSSAVSGSVESKIKGKE